VKPIKKVKTVKDIEARFIPAVDWIRRLGVETGAFDVVTIVEESRSRRDSYWEYIVTIAATPEIRQLRLFVETRSQLSPQLAIAAFQKLRMVPPDGLPILCAPYVSPRVAELCRNENVGYLDGVGNCRLATAGLFINISGHPNRRPAIETTIDPFSRKSSRIVRTLLTHPSTGWQVQKLAEAAGVSIGLASKVKNSLLEEAYLEERQKLLYLRDSTKLLNDWAKGYRPCVKRIQLFAMTRPYETELKIGQWCRSKGIVYALTQLAAAWHYSPMVRYDQCVVYVDKSMESQSNLIDFLEHIDAKKVDTGANCTIWLTDDPAVFSDARELDEVSIVSPLQLYLDLRQLAGRGEEAAEEIAAKKLQELFVSAANQHQQIRGEHK
jgi:hypothetical protein